MDSPFPGLRSYRVNEADWFFGRDGMSDAMASKLARQRFLAVIGESGCGKSSLVRAGLLPALNGGLLADAGSRWRILDLHPGGDPVGALSLALQRSGFREGSDRATLERDPGAIAKLRQQIAGEDNLLILVDQFEELFRFHAHRDEKAAFLQLLQEAVSQAQSRVYVIVTMRSDFIGLCSQFRGLPELINEGQYLVPRMTRENLRQAIEGPARLAGAEIESRLVQTLLNEVGSEPDQLPVLQHALMRTWNNWLERNNPDDPVREDPDYAKTGRLQNALSNHADEALHDASKIVGKDAEGLAQQVFVLLRDRDVNGQEVRRPTGVNEICAVTGAAPESIRALLEEFRKPGRTFLNASPDEWKDEEAFRRVEYDVTHESLIRKWTRLRDQWIPAELNSRRIYVRLAQQALDSDALNPSYMDGAVLDQSLDWADPPSGSALAKPTAPWADRYCHDFGGASTEGLFGRSLAFLRASSEARERRRAVAEEARRAEVKALRASAKKRFAYGASGILAVGLIAAVLVARHATRQREHATVLTIASSALLASQDPWQTTRSALLAGESLRRESTLLAAAVLSRSLSLIPKPLPVLEHSNAAFVSYSPGGTRVATADRQGAVKVWDLQTGKDLQTLKLDRKIKEFHLLDGSALILSDEGSLELWPLNGTKMASVCPEAGKYAASSSGRYIAAYCGDSLLVVDAGVEPSKFSTLPPAAMASIDRDPDFLAISDSGQWVSTATDTTGVKLLSVATGRTSGPVSVGELAAIGFTGADQAVAVRRSGMVRVWDPAEAAAGAEDYTLEGFGKNDRYQTVMAGKQGTLIVQSNGQALFAWSITGEQLAVADADHGVLGTAATGTEFAALDSRGDVRRWTLPALLEPPFRGKVSFFSPDGNWLLQRDGVTYRLTSTATRRGQLVNADNTGSYPIAFQPDGQRVAVRVNQAKPNLPPVFSGIELRTFENGKIGADALIPAIREMAPLTSATSSPNGLKLATLNRGGARGNMLSLWDMKTGQLIGQQALSRVSAVFFSADSQTLFWDDGEKLTAWNPAAKRRADVRLPVSDLRLLWAAATREGVAACVLSPGGRKAAAERSPEGQTVAIWKYPGWKEAIRMDNGEPVSNLAFSSDAHLLLTSTADGTFRIWDWSTGTQLAAVPTRAAVSGIAYRDDHRVVLLQSGRLRTYWWRNSDLHDELCRSAARELTLSEWKSAQLEERDFPKKKLCSGETGSVTN